ncbi:MAG: hypothetical protein UT92_C0009G0003 [Candidatus Curtissbacteria bacterium GW2011_GWA1_40_24]|uniref:Uncharacterized protein n=1 Tax=Candidatus Curtissbacteria bacterium GW2011_GWA1_40_24 TaxID=1618406 RepID=A0A0G0RYF0_9BACT|nr:MAG: hypothetical protein UT92_C0009G0003 [Candidatus Curtissbacteria bacterium GW2011_GWA1_40_24]
MTYLKWLWSKWLPIAQAIGNFNAQVILTIFYLVLMLPLGLIYRLFSDPLKIKPNKISQQKTNFGKWEYLKKDIETARKQY